MFHKRQAILFVDPFIWFFCPLNVALEIDSLLLSQMKKLSNCKCLSWYNSVLFNIHTFVNYRMFSKIKYTFLVEFSVSQSIYMIFFKWYFDTLIRPNIKSELFVFTFHNSSCDFSLLVSMNISFCSYIFNFGLCLPVSVFDLHSIESNSGNLLFRSFFNHVSKFC